MLVVNSNQTGGVITTRTTVDVARLCSHRSPQRCPRVLMDLLLNGPESWTLDTGHGHMEPCEGGTKWFFQFCGGQCRTTSSVCSNLNAETSCTGYVVTPTVSMVFLTIVTPAVGLLIIACCSENKHVCLNHFSPHVCLLALGVLIVFCLPG